MANYLVDPKILVPYLPKGVELDFYDGKCFISLVGFLFKNTRIFQLPIPYLGTFEEINLRFYVKYKEGAEIKRGVVFINETVPYKLVAWVANKLYNEHYTAIPTRNRIYSSPNKKNVFYAWKVDQSWHSLEVNTDLKSEKMLPGSIEEFIFEHYYGYTKVSSEKTREYRVNHPQREIHNVLDYNIQCDFEAMYGSDFHFLNQLTPDSVIMASGSAVSVDWKRKNLNF